MNNIPLFKFYSLLSNTSPFQYSYIFKLILIVLFASFAPILIISIYAILFEQSMAFLFLPFILSIISVGLNIFLLYLLLKPILFTSEQLHNYINDNIPLHLPVKYKDEIGVLMGDVQYITQKLAFLIHNQTKDANLDPLTGALSRQAGDERLRQDLARASRDNSKLLVALLDIDNFSQINEDFGRHIGDVCLNHVAKVTMHNIRKGDWISRWDGDSFLMVLWNFNNGEPQIVLDRIRKQSIHTPINELLKLNLSIGACDYQNEVDTSILLGKLNECMYQAKQSGQGGLEICERDI